MASANKKKTTPLRRLEWPGPKPYEETDWHCFFGREEETRELRSRLQGQRVTILAGASGTGKTSLLRAGLFAHLRLRRYHPTPPALKPQPVLVLRDWTTRSDTSAKSLLFDCLKHSVGAIDKWATAASQGFQRVSESPETMLIYAEMARKAKREYEILSKAIKKLRPAASLREVAEALLQALDQEEAGGAGPTDGNGSGLILAFDQLEELMRTGRYLDRDLDLGISTQIRELAGSGLPVNLLLSLRTEYLTGLRGLDQLVTGLMERTFYLEPMQGEKVQEALSKASEQYGSHFSGEPLQTLLGWISADLAGNPSRTLSSPDLLRLQAVLHSHSRWRGEVGRGAGKVTVLELNQFAESINPGGRPDEIAQRAMERWIEEALNAEEPTRTAAAEIHGEGLTNLLKRIAVRIAPHMSSGDYKVPQQEDALFQKALGDEILQLTRSRPTMRREITLTAAGIDWSKLTNENPDSHPEDLSWIARGGQWTMTKTGNELLKAFKESLARLSDGNVLKRGNQLDGDAGPSQATSWQLVHDQMGPALNQWAEARKNTFLDHRYSLIASNGITPIVVTEPNLETLNAGDRTIRDLCWIGCVVVPELGADSPPAVLDEVVFERCHFPGIIFKGFTFKGCIFRDCFFDGAIFTNCSFGRGSRSGAPCAFERCKPKGFLLEENTIEHLAFRECLLNQFIIRRGKVGYIEFLDSSYLLQASFVGLSRIAGASERCIVIRGEGSGGVFCTGDYESFEMVKTERECSWNNSSRFDRISEFS